MNEIGLFIKLSDSVEFLCIRAYQPPPYKYSITKGRITRGERNGAVRSLHRDSALRRRRVGEKGGGNSAKGPRYTAASVTAERDEGDIRLRYRQQPRPTSTLAPFPSPSSPSSPMKPSSFVATHPGAFAPALTSSRK
ncbi:hypothetical protein ALC56_11616 [Trachymyrmex septentrionalis]|uniref:Uncharacterized protein n=1 Tax=Trachymyrmex septentrionalis TaxID=34720 RepID=A0A195F156_9HYME|nr:hypothetical protein ALC56_11616 [Trachymyrmex septentrionalis]